jgi:hypothetical protein
VVAVQAFGLPADDLFQGGRVEVRATARRRI